MVVYQYTCIKLVFKTLCGSSPESFFSFPELSVYSCFILPLNYRY